MQASEREAVASLDRLFAPEGGICYQSPLPSSFSRCELSSPAFTGTRDVAFTSFLFARLHEGLKMMREGEMES